MASLAFTTLDVFTTEKFAGNPLAVVHLPADISLSQTQKQTIAREFNLSETVFLHLPPTTATTSSSNNNDNDNPPEWRLDIFTTEEELPFAGHPTIGAAVHALSTLLPQPSPSSSSSSSSLTLKGTFNIRAGPISLTYSPATQTARANIPHNIHTHKSHSLTPSKLLAWQPTLATYLSEQGAELKGLEVVSPVKGMSFALVELESLAALERVQTAGGRVQAQLGDGDGWGVGPVMGLFFVRMGVEEGGVVKLRTRMIEGTFEDPATGSASVALCGALAAEEKREGWMRFEVVQGVEMGRRSEIGVEVLVEGGVVKEVVLTGRAVRVMEGRVFYE